MKQVTAFCDDREQAMGQHEKPEGAENVKGDFDDFNITLNPGGLFGAIAGGGLAVVILCFTMDTAHPNQTWTKLFLGGVIGGAFAGNFAWARLFRQEPPEEEGVVDLAEDDKLK